MAIDFIVQLPLTRQGNNTIVVFTDRITKWAHFQAIHITVTASEVAKIFFNTIFKDHGISKVIVSNRDAKFTSHF